VDTVSATSDFVGLLHASEELDAGICL